MAKKLSADKEEIKRAITSRVTEPSALRKAAEVLLPYGYNQQPEVWQGAYMGQTFRTYVFQGGRLGVVVLVAGPNITTDVQFREETSLVPTGAYAELGDRVTRGRKQATREIVTEAREEAREQQAAPRSSWFAGKEPRSSGRTYDPGMTLTTRRTTPTPRSYAMPHLPQGTRSNPDTFIAPLGSRPFQGSARAFSREAAADDVFMAPEAYQEGTGLRSFTPYSAPEMPAGYVPPEPESPYFNAPFAALLEGMIAGEATALAEARRRLSLKGRSVLREQTKEALRNLSRHDAEALRRVLPQGHAVLAILPVEAVPAPVHEVPVSYRAPAVPQADEERAQFQAGMSNLLAKLSSLDDD